ncbi:putative ankyrin repeat protein L25 [Smittium mucronatum]|uniref:Putative ankyrin repeat protein L25 n=1 Tax=Smittium mucronatum TaxID=133383 RepID=A0A1R0H669_9FUNG|nr:putative ankyrin repeat protein L25 [Smittium mucronatum]
MVDNGANIKAQNNQVLINMCGTECFRIIEYLIKKGAEINSQNGQTLINACMGGFDVDIVRYLVEKCVEINAQNGQALAFSCSRLSDLSEKYCIEDSSNEYPYYCNTCLRITKYLIDNGSDVNA